MQLRVVRGTWPKRLRLDSVYEIRTSAEFMEDTTTVPNPFKRATMDYAMLHPVPFKYTPAGSVAAPALIAGAARHWQHALRTAHQNSMQSRERDNDVLVVDFNFKVLTASG